MKLNQFSKNIIDDTISEQNKMEAFVSFYNYYSKLVEKVLNGQKFTDKELTEEIFDSWERNIAQNKYEKYLFSSLQTLERIKLAIETNTINKFNLENNKISIKNFSEFLFIFSVDVFDLVRFVEEKHYNNQMGSRIQKRHDSSIYEIFETATIILNIKLFGVSSIQYRDFFSYTIYTIRLMIEVAGKAILGYNTITDEKGNRVGEISSQIAWHFIKNDQKLKKRIELPLEIDTILKIESWTNQFIHTGNIQPIFLIENALTIIEKLSIPRNTKIFYYKELKKDFEKFVNSKIKRKRKIIINWQNSNKIDINEIRTIVN